MAVDKQTLEQILSDLERYGATLVAVSKTRPADEIREVFEAGHKHFGENYTRELAGKAGQLPVEIRWHYIGHLQRNKVREIISFVHLIHSVDSERLVKEIDKQSKKAGRIVEILLQVHIAREETKFGFNMDECEQCVQMFIGQQYSSVKLRGLMGMATFTDDKLQIREEFRGLRQFFDKLKTGMPEHLAVEFSVLSMGMSSDYKIALEEGSTMVRIGSAIFGERKG